MTNFYLLQYQPHEMAEISRKLKKEKVNTPKGTKMNNIEASGAIEEVEGNAGLKIENKLTN